MRRTQSQTALKGKRDGTHQAQNQESDRHAVEADREGTRGPEVALGLATGLVTAIITGTGEKSKKKK
jgi:hypothetical protein